MEEEVKNLGLLAISASFYKEPSPVILNPSSYTKIIKTTQRPVLRINYFSLWLKHICFKVYEKVYNSPL